MREDDKFDGGSRYESLDEFNEIRKAYKKHNKEERDKLVEDVSKKIVEPLKNIQGAFMQRAALVYLGVDEDKLEVIDGQVKFLDEDNESDNQKQSLSMP